MLRASWRVGAAAQSFTFPCAVPERISFWRVPHARPAQTAPANHTRAGTAIREGSYWKCATEPWCISMPPTPQNLYLELGRLIAGTPELVSGPITPDVRRWLASANALVRSSGSLTDGLQFAAACENLDGPLRGRHAETVTTILRRMLVKAELNAPPELRGSVLLIGEDRDADTAMRHLLRTATSDALLVEPDAAGKILADYAILAHERVAIRLLADEAQYRPSLIGGVRRWQQRLGENRKLTVRLASANTLHERLILLDGERAWVSGVPFNDLAKKLHTTLVRMRPEAEARKIEVYSEIWEVAKPLSPPS